jgi:hypothetical protein
MIRAFQFRLRTLLIVITLLAVPWAYVGWQARIVRQRKAMMSELNGTGASVYLTSEIAHIQGANFGIDIGDRTIRPPYPTASGLRELLGDDFVLGIVLSQQTPPVTVSRIRATFPEAMVVFQKGPN